MKWDDIQASPDAPKRLKWDDIAKGGSPSPGPSEPTNDPYGPKGETTEGATSGVPGWFNALFGGVGHGLGNVIHGAARIGARMGQAPEIGGTAPPMSPEQLQQVDTTARQREQAYQASPTVKQYPTASKIGELGGEIAGVLAEGGPLAAAAPARAVPRWMLNLGMGAGTALATPKGDESMTPAAQLERGAAGLAGGALGAGVGEGVSRVAKALAGNLPTEIESMLTRGFRRTVKPSIAGPQSAPRIEKADRDIVGVFDEIADNKATLQYADPLTGATTQGQTPQNMAQFADAIFQRKAALWKEITDKSAAAGEKGAMVDLKPMSERLMGVAKEVELANPQMADAILMDADRYAARGSVTPTEAEGLLKTFNRETAAWWKNPNSVTAHRTHALVEAAGTLRETLDKSITQLEGPGYQALRTRYGKLKAVEDSVAKAALRDQKNLPGGLIGELLQAGGATELLHGIIDPTKLPRAGGMLLVRMWFKKLRDPNAAIARLFRIRERPMATGMPLALVERAQKTLPKAAVPGGLVGGQLGAQFYRDRERQRREPRVPAAGG